MVNGDLTLLVPGALPDVVVEADANGDIPERGAAVEIVGSSRGRVHVGALTAPENFIGTLKRRPTSYDPNETYAAGEVVGESVVLLRHYVDQLSAADASTLSAGDLVVADTNGVRAYDPVAEVDGGAEDPPHAIIGPVWTTQSTAAGTAGKVAVVRHR